MTSQKGNFLACFLIQDSADWENKRLSIFVPKPGQSLEASVPSTAWISQRNIPPLPCSSVSVSEGGEYKTKKLVLSFFFHFISGQSKRFSFKCQACPFSGPCSFIFQDFHALSWIGSDPCILDGTLSYPWLLASMHLCASLVWRSHVCLELVGKSFQGATLFCPFGLWSSYLGRSIKYKQCLVNFKRISPCNRSSLTATINLDSTLLSFCVWLADSLSICPLLTCTPGVLQAVQ